MPETVSLRQSAGDERPGADRGAILRPLLQLAAVLAAAAIVLRSLDAIPTLVTGTPRGVRHFQTVAQLEHALGWRVPLPAYFPDLLAWPPADLQRVDQAAALVFTHRTSGAQWLLFELGSDQNSPLPTEFASDALVLQDSETRVGAEPARVRRLRAADGTFWLELAWRSSGRFVRLRYRGALEELEMIADSLQEPHR